VSYLGYPATTGNPAIDARLVDVRSDPPGSEALCTERLVRIDPCVWCFSEPAGAPDVTPPPCGVEGPVTFGSFNNLAKTVPAVLDAWAALLRTAPGTRLLLKNAAFIDAATREGVRGQLTARGVRGEQIELLAPTRDAGGHLAAYSRVDVALDTFPYAGTTTTCEALWMGVPVVTLAGTMHAGRVGVSLLGALGMDAMIGPDIDGYIRSAASLAADRARLATLRSTLRERMRASRLMDRAHFRAQLHAAYAALVRERTGEA
jgi:predicted O-linked N-acetylglucosamine transferase (SPINDLY family)